MTPRRSIGPVHFGPGEEFDLIRRLVNPADLLPTGVSSVSYTHLTLPTKRIL